MTETGGRRLTPGAGSGLYRRHPSFSSVGTLNSSSSSTSSRLRGGPQAVPPKKGTVWGVPSPAAEGHRSGLRRARPRSRSVGSGSGRAAAGRRSQWAWARVERSDAASEASLVTASTDYPFISGTHEGSRGRTFSVSSSASAATAPSGGGGGGGGGSGGISQPLQGFSAYTDVNMGGASLSASCHSMYGSPRTAPVRAPRSVTDPTASRGREEDTRTEGSVLGGRGGASSRVRVGVRMRPPFRHEIDRCLRGRRGRYQAVVEAAGERQQQQQQHGGGARADLEPCIFYTEDGRQRSFPFDFSFGASAGQAEVYDRLARPVVTGFLEGVNGSIIAYGQTGTGKTHTMGILDDLAGAGGAGGGGAGMYEAHRRATERWQQSPQDAGIIPAALAQIFAHTRAHPEVEVSLEVSMLQIYSETVFDLLAAPPSRSVAGPQTGEEKGALRPLAVRENPQEGFYVEGLQRYAVLSYDQAAALVDLGLANRAMASTSQNASSSRSHTVLSVRLVQLRGRDSCRSVSSKLLIADLAGSERASRVTRRAGLAEDNSVRRKEARFINSSLSALGNVITALAQPEESRPHVPYRDSKLTRILHDSLGGSANTALIATLGPSEFNRGETLSTLLFASRCMCVRSAPVRHEKVDYVELAAQLQAKLTGAEEEASQRAQETARHYQSIIERLTEDLTAERGRNKEGGGQGWPGESPTSPANSRAESHPWQAQVSLGQGCVSGCIGNRGGVGRAAAPDRDEAPAHSLGGGEQGGKVEGKGGAGANDSLIATNEPRKTSEQGEEGGTHAGASGKSLRLKQRLAERWARRAEAGAGAAAAAPREAPLAAGGTGAARASGALACCF